MKNCRLCGESFGLDRFPLNRKAKDGRASYCKPCTTAFSKKWKAETGYKPPPWAGKKESDRRYYVDNHTAIRQKAVGQRLTARYGITLEDYDQMLERQGGACAVCGTTTPGGRGNRFHVDHCHASGKVRGLLCWSCNRRLGVIENEAFMQAATKYLAGT